MSRYRPPPPRQSPYITPLGAQLLRQELKHLYSNERPQITASVHEAAKNGDRSENGDYIYGKQRLREIDRRIRYLSKRLEQFAIVDRLPENTEQVFFAAYVDIIDQHNHITKLRIVGADETEREKINISFDSPMAQALLGKKRGDNIEVTTPHGFKQYKILAIRYKNPHHN